MPAFLHRPVPSFDGENELNGCPKNWMVVQFSADWMEAKIILFDGMMKGGGRKGHATADGRINKPHSPPAKIFRPSSESNKTRAKAKAKASFE